MSAWLQLRLSLWKDIKLRQKHPMVLLSDILWPVAVCLIIYITRLNVDIEYKPSCQYSPRALPSAGLLPFTQSFLCNINNECEDLQYEKEIPPTFDDTKIGKLTNELTPVIQNESFANMLKKIPNAMKMLTTVIDIMEDPNVVELTGPGLQIKDLFRSEKGIKDVLKDDLKLNFRQADLLLEARINISHLMTSLKGLDFSELICNPGKLGLVIVSDNEKLIGRLSDILCNYNRTHVSDLLLKVVKNVDFTGIFHKIGDIMQMLGHKDVFSGIGAMVDSIIRLQGLQNIIPKNIDKLYSLLPDMLPLIHSLNSSNVDLNIINIMLDSFDPVLNKTNNWSSIKRVFNHLISFLTMIQDRLLQRTTKKINVQDLFSEIKDDISVLQDSDNILFTKSLRKTRSVENSIENIWKIVNSSLILMENAIGTQFKAELLFVNFLDVIKDVFPYIGNLTRSANIWNQVIRISNNILIIELENENILNRISQQFHDELEMISSLQSKTQKRIFEILQDVEKVNMILNHIEDPYSFFCETENIISIFGNDTELNELETMLCNRDWSEFLKEIDIQMGFKEIRESVKIISNKTSIQSSDYNEKISMTVLLENINKLFNKISSKEWFKSEIDKPILNKEEWNFVSQLKYKKRFLLFSAELATLKYLYDNAVEDKELVRKGVIVFELLLDIAQEEMAIFSPNSVKYSNEENVQHSSQWNKLLTTSNSFYETIKNEVRRKEYINLKELSDEIRKVFNGPIDGTKFILSGALVSTKILEVLDSSILFNVQKYNDWNKFQQVGKLWNSIFSYLHNISTKILSTEGTTISEIFSGTPLTENIAKTILKNLVGIMEDLSSNQLDAVKLEKFLNESSEDWPCSEQSIGSIFELRNSSAEALKLLEQLMCEPDEYIEEWENNKTASFTNIWKSNNNKVDWRQGYKDFRNLVNDFLKLKDYKEDFFKDVPNLNTKKLIASWVGNISNIDVDVIRAIFKVLDKRQDYLEETSDSLSDKFFDLASCLDDDDGPCTELQIESVSYVGKIIPNILSEMLAILTKYINEIKNGADLLRVAGFTKETGIYILFDKVPDLLEMVVHSYQYEKFQKQSVAVLKERDHTNCLRLINNLTIPEGSSITNSDLEILTDYACPTIFKIRLFDDNVMLQLAGTAQKIYYEPINSLNETYELLADKIFELSDTIQSVPEEGIKIKIIEEDWAERLEKKIIDLSKKHFTQNTSIMNVVNDIMPKNSSFNNYLEIFEVLDKVQVLLIDNLREMNNSNIASTSLHFIGSGLQKLILENIFTPACNDNNSCSPDFWKNISKFDVFKTGKLNIVYKKNEPFLIETALQHTIETFFFFFENRNTTYKESKFLLPDEKNLRSHAKDLSKYLTESFKLKKISNSVLKTSDTLLLIYSNILKKASVKGQKMELLNSFHNFIDIVSISGKLTKVINENKNISIDELLCAKDKQILENEYSDVLISLQTKYCSSDNTKSLRSDIFNTKDSQITINELNLEEHIFEFYDSYINFLKTVNDEFHINNGNYSTGKYSVQTGQVNTMITIFEIVVSLMKSNDYNNRKCDWCEISTLILKEITEQILNAQLYEIAICNKLNSTDENLFSILLNDFKWKDIPKKFSQKHNYQYKDFINSLQDVMGAMSSYALIHIQDHEYSGKIKTCLENFSKSQHFVNIKSFFGFITNALRVMGRTSTHINEIIEFQAEIPPLMNYLQNQVELLLPLQDIITSKDILLKDMLILGYMNNEFKDIITADINVNRMNSLKLNEFNEYFTTTDKLKKIIKLKTDSYQDFVKSPNDRKKRDFSKILYNNIDFTLLNSKLPNWQYDNIWSLNWLSDLMNNADDLFNNGNEIMKTINDITVSDTSFDNYSILQMFDMVLQLLKDSTLNKLYTGFEKIIHDLQPIIHNSVLADDFDILLRGIRSVNDLKSQNLISMKYDTDDLLTEKDELREYLIDTITLPVDIVDTVLNGYIDITPILTENRTIHLKTYICDYKQLQKIFQAKNNKYNNIENMKRLSVKLCKVNSISGNEVLLKLLNHLNITTITQQFVTKTIDNIVAKANLTDEEGKAVKEIVKEASVFIEPLRSSFQSASQLLVAGFNPDEVDLDSGDASNPDTDFIARASKLACGKPIIRYSNKIIKSIAGDIKRVQKLDPNELSSFTTPFCRGFYETMLNLDAGTIVWSYAKPLLRGKIIYTPNDEVTAAIIKNANSTFQEIAQMGETVRYVSKALNSVFDMLKYQNNTDNLQNILDNPIIKTAIGGIGLNDGIFQDIDLKDILKQIKDMKQITSVLNMTSEMMNCVILDRFVGVDSEADLELLAIEMIRTNEFGGAIVFSNHIENNSTGMKKSISKNVEYKIRMDVDTVPSTSRAKEAYWIPGPNDNFLEDMRYFRGFVQLQDMIDTGLIKMYSNGSVMKDKIYTKQFPYPCFKNDIFQKGLHILQGIMVIFFIGMIVIIASAVRFRVWERESQNTMLMNIMGLKLPIHLISWFIMVLLEIWIIMICLVVILKAGNILPQTDPTILLFAFLSYGIAVTVYCFLMTELFKSASLAAAGSVIFYTTTFLPFVLNIAMETEYPFWLKVASNFCMSSSLGYITLYISRYELQVIGLQWSNAWASPMAGDRMNFGICMIQMYADIIIFLIIAFIIRKIRTVESNVKNDSIVNTDENHMKAGVVIENLTKVYENGKNNSKVVIDNVNLKLYRGEITTLLGYNGAGKTTLIKMLIGNIAPTGGKITIHDSRFKDINTRNQYLGICPQTSILLPKLSAREHLTFYAQLKMSANKKDVYEEVEQMITNMGLGYLANEPVYSLSGGTKRRLCVAIAFIGQPSLVILDEPSSGVDPVARREIWDLIIKHKNDRTILLTTHHLDEAELLSDRIVILHNGKVHCSGTPLSLKHNYGNGYLLDVIYSENVLTKLVDKEKSTNLLNAVSQVITNASIEKVGKENVTIILPFCSSNGTQNNFQKVAEVLEEEQDRLGFNDFSFNCTTLEKVFLDICHKADYSNTAEKSSIIKMNNSLPKVNYVSEINLTGSMKTHFDNEHLTYEKKHMMTTWYQMFWALMQKRAIHYIKDRRLIVSAIVFPVIFTFVAMLCFYIRTADERIPSSLKLDREMYPYHVDFLSMPYNEYYKSPIQRNLVDMFQTDPEANSFIFHNKTEKSCKCKLGEYECSKKTSPSDLKHNVILPNVKETTHWLVDTQKEYIERRYGGWSFEKTTSEYSKNIITVWYNNEAYHPLPIYVNVLSNAVLKSYCNDCSITVYNHPMQLYPDKLNEATMREGITNISIAFTLLVAFSLVAVNGIVYLVHERTYEEKRLQMLAGVTPKLYWAVAIICDLIVYLFSLVICILIIKSFNEPAFTERDNLYGIMLMLFMFGWACINLAHLTEKAFRDSSIANMTLFVINVTAGLTLLATILLIDILGKTKIVEDIRNVLHIIFFISPQYVLGDGLAVLLKNQIKADILKKFNLDTYQSPLGWDLLGYHYLSLGVFGLLFFISNIIVENHFVIRKKKQMAVVNKSTILETVNLRKEFVTTEEKRIAVDSLSLKIPPGVCYGLLGVNGAGKSTTFRMLTTEITPTSGKIIIEGQEITQASLCTGQLGYCPQIDAMDNKLTTRQCLKFYATLKGIKDINHVTTDLMNKFGLAQYADQRFENLSGGNKRKVCAAVSILGPAPIILMDEPTSGMDPGSRTLVATAIQDEIRQGKCVVLTSHSMEECELLCSEVAIMVRGQVACSGSPPELKARYGGGYLVSIRLKKENQKDSLNQLVHTVFPGCELQNQQYCSSQYLVPMKNLRTSELFSKMKTIESSLNIEDYSIIRSSLDQVFINLTNLTKTKTLSHEISMDGYKNSISMQSLNTEHVAQDLGFGSYIAKL